MSFFFLNSILYDAQNCSNCIHACNRCKHFIEVDAGLVCEPSCYHSFLVLLHIPISILLCLINPFELITSLSFGTSTSSHVWFFSMHSISSSIACAHNSYSISSSNVSGSYIGENNANRENELGVPASYISHRLLVFTGSVDVDLD